MSVFSEYRVRARNIDPTSDNKIHDDDVARKLGFGGALVPGVEVFAYLTSPLVEVWGTEFLRRGRVDVRFRQPVYDGDDVVALAVETTDDGVALELRGPDDTVRAVGTAALSAGAAVDLGRFTDTPVPSPLPPASAESLPPGPLGSICEDVDERSSSSYLAAISESLPIYAEQSLVHPGALLRMVNAVLVRNVELGPWIHTASSCVLLGLAPVPSTLRAHAVVTDTFKRNGHDYVRYDALVLSDDRPVMLVEHSAIYRVAGQPSG